MDYISNIFLILWVLVTIRILQILIWGFRLLNKISLKSEIDIDRGNYNWKWRYYEFDEIYLLEVLLKFWRSLDSFIPKRLLEDLKDYKS
jgi:hypothetical protein